MKKIALTLSVLFVLAISIGNFSCKDPDPEPQDTTKTVLNEQTVDDGVNSTEIITDVIAEVLVSADENSADKKTYPKTCATVTLEPTVGYPKTLTIDYGTSGCSMNGHTISGTITATISDKLRTEGTTVSILFTDFSIDTLAVDGAISLTINSVSIANNTIDFSAALSAVTVTMPSGNIQMGGSMDITWNINTLTNYEDDSFNITSGSYTGTNKRGKIFTGSIIETLVYTVECETFVDGKIEFETSEIAYPATIDFGNGTCDHLAIVTTTIEITVGNYTYTEDYSYEIILP
ncbi:MAG: hypothetical protein JXR68_11775 [Bacteroidales bacterium]|nr:hypothetical protein [Bacteroidales bacterium]